MSTVPFVRLAVLALSLAGFVGCGNDAGHETAQRPTPTPEAGPTTAAPPTPTAVPSPAFPLVLLAACGPTTVADPSDCPPGLLVRSEDGGRTWSQQRFEHAFADLSFVDRSKGWAVTGDDVLRTVDGGETWESLGGRVPSIAAGPCNDGYSGISFLDERAGVVIGAVDCGITIGDSFVLRTSDGGETWEVAFSGGAAWYAGLRDVCFTDAGVGFAAGPEIVLVSGDHGESWDRVDQRESGPSSGTSVACAGDRDLWLLDDLYPAVQHSTDAGGSWVDLEQSMPPGPNGLPATIGFFDTGLGWIAAGQDTLVLTRDGGASWEVTALVNGPVPFERAAFLDQRRGLAFSWAAAALTEDGGQSWRLVAVTPGVLTRFLDVEVIP